MIARLIRVLLAGTAAALLSPAAAFAQNPPEEPHHDEPDARPFPGLSIEARVEEVADPATGDHVRTLHAKGKCNYPDGISLVLEMRLKGDGEYLQKKVKVFVTSGEWDGVVDELGRNVYKGEYEVRVQFDPQQQSAAMMHRISAELNEGAQEKVASVRIGTAEEEAAEKADVNQFYARNYAAARAISERIFAMYESQLKSVDRAQWKDFLDEAYDRLNTADRELGDWRRLRDNVRDFAVYEKLQRIYATKDMLLPDLSAALGIEGGKGTAQERQAAQEMLADLRTTLNALDAQLGAVKIDPNWKMPQPLAFHTAQTAPPGVTGRDNFRDPQPSFVPPKPRAGAPATSFGIAELGIGFAVMCGIAMLAVLLKRR